MSASRRNSRASRLLLAFFRANPDEWLTVPDAAAKLGIAESTARLELGLLSGEGSLERCSVYRLKTDPADQEIV